MGMTLAMVGMVAKAVTLWGIDTIAATLLVVADVCTVDSIEEPLDTLTLLDSSSYQVLPLFPVLIISSMLSKAK